MSSEGRKGARARSLNLTRFQTDGDVNLSRFELLLQPPGAAGAGELGTPGGRALTARHARVGGELELPRCDASIDHADLSFLQADSLEVHGHAFASAVEASEKEVARLDLSNAKLDSIRITSPIPQPVNLMGTKAASWDVRRGQGSSGNDGSNLYLELLGESKPFAQGAYADLERDFREQGDHRTADRILEAMGWRLWRDAYVKGGSGGRRLIRRLLAPITGAFHVLYGFGVRWWLPLMISGACYALVTIPLVSDCRNLGLPRGGAVAVTSEQRWSLGSVSICTSCTLEALPGASGPPTSTGDRAMGDATEWSLSDAAWLGLRYHVPIIPLDAFYEGAPEERVRPVGWAAAWARCVHLASWIVVPFSLLFAAARAQRKYRLLS